MKINIYIFTTLSMLSMGMIMPSSVSMARPNPFYPITTSQNNLKQALAYPFDSYRSLGYVKGPDKTLALIETPTQQVLYLKIGQPLGREKFIFNRILKEGQLAFSKSIKDMHGKNKVIRRTIDITGK
jgi:Tfp pilus assembly protein PilP